MGHERWAKHIEVANPGRPTPAMVRSVRRFLAPLVHACHRPTLEGTEHLPARGPFLLVANHSGGVGIAELSSFLVTYLEKVGPERPLAGFALPLGFLVFPLSAAWRELGVIPSTYTSAESALAKEVPILVFPGGDHETFRPFWQANRVDFGGRVGFLRIARAAGVPIVPLGIRGGYLTAPMLFRSRLLPTLLVVPRLIGAKRWGVSFLGALVAALILTLVPLSLPARLALVWIWLGSPLTLLPWIPWTLRLRIGAPILPATIFPSGASGGDDELRRALVVVERAVQKEVDL